MFGFVYYLFMGILRIFAGVIEFFEDENSRIEARNNNRDVYFDRKGFSHLTATREPVFRTTQNGMDFLVYGCGKGVYRNLSFELYDLKKKVELYREDAIKNGYSTYLFFSEEDLRNCRGMKCFKDKFKYNGDIYHDIETDQFYKIDEIFIQNEEGKVIKEGYYYIDLNNNHIVREIDNPKYSKEMPRLTEEDIININNRRDNGTDPFATCVYSKHIREGNRDYRLYNKYLMENEK